MIFIPGYISLIFSIILCLIIFISILRQYFEDGLSGILVLPILLPLFGSISGGIPFLLFYAPLKIFLPLIGINLQNLKKTNTPNFDIEYISNISTIFIISFIVLTLIFLISLILTKKNTKYTILYYILIFIINIIMSFDIIYLIKYFNEKIIISLLLLISIPIKIFFIYYFFRKFFSKENTNPILKKPTSNVVNGDIEYLDKKIWLCSKCGTKNDIYLSLCSKCGKEFGNNNG